MSTAETNGERVDHTALRVNQAFIITFLVLGFLLNQPMLVGFVALVMVLGTITPSLALFQRIYRDGLRPAGVLKPDIQYEAAGPHRFAQGMGATVLLIAGVALLAGAAALGWGLAMLVVVLAAVNLFFGFCAGCFVFFQLQRLRRA
jgi:DMSO reductase anchor subunit